MTLLTDEQREKMRTILQRLRSPTDNPVLRARHMVERHVPEDRRGPGWERHWRELEAYLQLPGTWSAGTAMNKEENDDG